jgi:hypothetical protein
VSVGFRHLAAKSGQNLNASDISRCTVTVESTSPFFFLVSFLGLRFAAATACGLLPLPTVLDEYERSNVVITARLVSIEKTKEPDPMHFNIRSATMVVQKVFKGTVYGNQSR